MNAAFLLLTSAWMAGGDACCGCAAPACGCDCGCCCCKPTLRDRFDAFRNACGSPKCCGCCGCGCDCGCCCCKPSLRDRLDAFMHACGTPKCCGCCTPCCGCGAPCGCGGDIGHGAPAIAPGAAPYAPEQIAPPKEAPKKMPGAGEPPLKIGAVPQIETPKTTTVIVEPEVKSPF